MQKGVSILCAPRIFLFLFGFSPYRHRYSALGIYFSFCMWAFLHLFLLQHTNGYTHTHTQTKQNDWMQCWTFTIGIGTITHNTLTPSTGYTNGRMLHAIECEYVRTILKICRMVKSHVLYNISNGENTFRLEMFAFPFTLPHALCTQTHSFSLPNLYGDVQSLRNETSRAAGVEKKRMCKLFVVLASPRVAFSSGCIGENWIFDQCEWRIYHCIFMCVANYVCIEGSSNANILCWKNIAPFPSYPYFWPFRPHVQTAQRVPRHIQINASLGNECARLELQTNNSNKIDHSSKLCQHKMCIDWPFLNGQWIGI